MEDERALWTMVEENKEDRITRDELGMSDGAAFAEFAAAGELRQ